LLNEGIVLRAVSGVYTVQSNGHLVHCTLRGNLKKELQYSTSTSFARRVTRAKRPHATDTVAIGDRVKYAEGQKGAGVIEEVLPRRSRFVRAGFRGQEQTLVCNLDQVVIVFTCAEPRPDPWKLDRFLAATENEGLDPLIVGNKLDLITLEEARETYAEWERIGYRILFTSTKTGQGIDDLRAALNDKISAFVGPSGAGKSSLLNAIQPGLNLKTGDIGYVTYKGRHTTTASQLIPLRSGGWVADTPGLRQLDLFETDRDDLVHCFPEFRPNLGKCKFDDCRHDKEPGCAIKSAVDEGAISARRYESFQTMAAEVEPAGRR
jgi:ribosome biogenesis GTPase / thiamine phosphate phosphatase